MHRRDTEFGQEPKGKQIQITVYKTVQSELGFAIFACLMMNNFFSDTVEACILSKVGNVTVHFSIHLNILDDFPAIGFQSTVEVVQILDAGHSTGCGIEQFGRNGF